MPTKFEGRWKITTELIASVGFGLFTLFVAAVTFWQHSKDFEALSLERHNNILKRVAFIEDRERTTSEVLITLVAQMGNVNDELHEVRLELKEVENKIDRIWEFFVNDRTNSNVGNSRN